MGKQAGFKPTRTKYKLNFSQTELAGLEVTAAATSVKGLTRLVSIGAELDDLDPENLEPAELIKKLTAAFEPFARLLVSWNIVDEDDQPVPATLDGLLDQDPAFIGRIIEAYVSAVSEAPPPLPGSSSSGGTSPDAPPDLASGSRSLGSSPGPS